MGILGMVFYAIHIFVSFSATNYWTDVRLVLPIAAGMASENKEMKQIKKIAIIITILIMNK